MANDDDLIRRGDALAALSLGDIVLDRSAVKTIAALPAVTVGVKPLVWERGRSGDYSIQETHGQGPKPYMVTRGSKVINWCHTESEGEVIADKDNTARILAALEPQPAPDAAAIREVGLAELVRERDELRSWDDYFRKTCGYKRDGRPSPECLDEFIRGVNDTNRDAALSAAIREVALREAAKVGADAAFNYWAEAEKPVSQRKYGGAGLPASVSLAILALITEKPHDR